jgi:hypothetical protein
MTAQGLRAGVVAVGIFVALALVLVIAAWSATERAPFRSGAAGSFAQVEAAITGAGLVICRRTDDPGGQANQAVASRSYEVALDCSDQRTSLVVDRFADAGDRDAAARAFEGLNRPRAGGVVYTLGDSVIYQRGTGEDEVGERLGAALTQAGAR